MGEVVTLTGEPYRAVITPKLIVHPNWISGRGMCGWRVTGIGTLGNFAREHDFDTEDEAINFASAHADHRGWRWEVAQPPKGAA